MTDEQPWHSLTEAAAMTGLDREAVRSRARRGLLPSRKNNRGETLVQVPAEMMTTPDHPAAMMMTTIHEAVADLLTELAEVKTELARAEAQVAAARAVAVADVATAEAKVEARDMVIAELKEMLAEARRPWWRRWLS